jgi:hypothetical protein
MKKSRQSSPASVSEDAAEASCFAIIRPRDSLLSAEAAAVARTDAHIMPGCARCMQDRMPPPGVPFLKRQDRIFPGLSLSRGPPPNR